MEEEEELIFKVCVMGDGQVGKTSLIRRMFEDKFDEQVDPYPDLQVWDD